MPNKAEGMVPQWKSFACFVFPAHLFCRLSLCLALSSLVFITLVGRAVVWREYSTPKRLVCMSAVPACAQSACLIACSIAVELARVTALEGEKGNPNSVSKEKINQAAASRSSRSSRARLWSLWPRLRS